MRRNCSGRKNEIKFDLESEIKSAQKVAHVLCDF